MHYAIIQTNGMYVLSIDPGIKNFAYCFVDAVDGRILSWDCVELRGDDIADSLADVLHKFTYYGTGPIHVVVESQTSRNTRTNRIVDMIQMFFTINHYNIGALVMYSPKHKIRHYIHEPCDAPMVTVNGKEYLSERLSKLKPGSYRATKAIVVEHCKRLLTRFELCNPALADLDIHPSLNNKPRYDLAYFNGYKKQDDLADSYVQAMSYMKRVLNREIPKIYM